MTRETTMIVKKNNDNNGKNKIKHIPGQKCRHRITTTKTGERVATSKETPVWRAAEYWNFISSADRWTETKQFDKFLFYTERWRAWGV